MRGVAYSAYSATPLLRSFATRHDATDDTDNRWTMTPPATATHADDAACWRTATDAPATTTTADDDNDDGRRLPTLEDEDGSNGDDDGDGRQRTTHDNGRQRKTTDDDGDDARRRTTADSLSYLV